MADFNSKYTGEQVEEFLDQIANGEIGGGGGITAETDPIFSASPAASITEAKKTEWDNKQDAITDLEIIRSGAEKGATALQSVPSGYATTSDLDGKVDKVSGKQLSTEDFTSALKTKLEGLSNYDDTELSEALSTLRGDFDKLVSGDTSTAIESFNEIMAFLDGIKDTQDLAGIIAAIEQQIAGKMDKVTLATVATSGSYNDLSNKPTIPTTVSQLDNDAEYITHEDVAAVARTGSYNDLEDKPTIPVAVTESTVSGWGFTKNTGTLTGVAINGTAINANNGVVYIPNASTGSYGTTKLNPSTDSTSILEAATPSAVKAAYDLANSKQDKLESGTNIKTINGQSIVGSGNLIIEGGSIDGFVTKVKVGELDVANTQALYDDNTVYALPSSANGDEDDILVSERNLKTINGQSIVGSGDIEISGGGGGDSSVFITHFTVDEFTSSNIEFTDEQTEAIRNAAKQNKIIALPYSVDSGHSGFVVSSYRYTEDFSSGKLYWYLSLTITYDNTNYNNDIDVHDPKFSFPALTIQPIKTLVEYVPVDEEGYALADSYNKDNLIIVVEGECTYLQIGEVGSEYGMTVRFFTGEDCAIDYFGNWANGVIPTIEPYTAYEMSIVHGADYIQCAVLTPFKPVE